MSTRSSVISSASTRRQGKVPANVKQYVDSQLKRTVELRKFDVVGQFGISPTVVPTVINNIPTANRQDEVVNFESLEVKLTLAIPVTFTLKGPAMVRYMVIEWKPLSIPTLNDILETVTPISIINSRHRLTTKQFYRVLIDETFQLFSSWQTAQKFQRTLNLGNKKVRFDDGVVPADAVGLLYYIAVSDQSVAGEQPLFNYSHRVTYTDA